MLLNIYSHYSKPEGSIKFTDLAALAREKGLKTLALTDHGNFSGITEFYHQCLLNSIKPIIGLDFFYQLPDSTFVRLIIYLRNFEGYGQILKIIPHLQTAAEGYVYLKSGFNFKADNLICLIGLYKIDYYSELLAISRIPELAVSEINLLADFHSVFFQLLYDEHPDNQDMSALLLEKAKNDQSLRLAAINPVYCLNRQDFHLKEFLLLHYKNQHFSRSYQTQYAESITDCQDFFPAEAIANRRYIADQCNLLLDQLPFFFPKINFKLPDSGTAIDELKEIVNRNLEYHYSDAADLADLRERIEFEFSIIRRDGLAVFIYFLYVLKDKFSAQYKGRIYFGGRLVYFFSAYLLRLIIVSPLSFKTNYSKAVFNIPEHYPVIVVNIAAGQKNNFRNLLSEIFGIEKICALVDFVQWNAASLISALGKYQGHSKETIDSILKNIPVRYRFEPLKNILRIDSLRNLLSDNYAGKELLRFAWLLDETSRITLPDNHSLVIGHHCVEDILPVQTEINGSEVLKKTFYDLETAKYFGVWTVQVNTYKALDILDQTVPEDRFLTENGISHLAADLVRAAKNRNLDFLPFISYREDKIRLLGLFGNNNIYNLSLYLESYLFSLEQLESKVETPVEKSLQADLKYTGGKIVFYEQLVYILEKMFKDKAYSKAKKLIYGSRNIHYFKKMLSNLVHNKSDLQHIKWLGEACLPSVFLTSLGDTGFRIFLILKMLSARSEHYTEFLMHSFLEAINNDTADYEKYLDAVKKSGIAIQPLLVENTVLRAEYSRERAELYLPLYVIRGIAPHLSDYLHGFCAANRRISTIYQFLELVDKEYLRHTHCELLAKAGFFDGLNMNRKANELTIRNFYEVSSQQTRNQQELFALETFLPDQQEITDYTRAEKRELEEKITGFVFTGISRLDITDFTEHLLIPDHLKIVYYLKNIVPGQTALFIDTMNSKSELQIPAGFTADDYHAYLIKLDSTNKIILSYKIIVNPWHDLEFRLFFSAASTQTELFNRLITFADPAGSCSFRCYLTDLGREISGPVRINLNRTRMKEFVKLLRDNPYYLESMEV